MGRRDPPGNLPHVQCVLGVLAPCPGGGAVSIYILRPDAQTPWKTSTTIIHSGSKPEERRESIFSVDGKLVASVTFENRMDKEMWDQFKTRFKEKFQ